MIYAQPGAPFQAVLDGAPTGKTGEVGIRLLRDSDGSTAIARTTANITELLTGSGIYLAKGLVAPTIAGNYTIVWDDGSVGPTTATTEEMVVTSTSPVATLPNPGDLCTLAEVKALLKLARTDQDELLQTLITPASRAVIRWTDREFAPITIKETRSFEWDWEGELCSLAPYDVQAKTEERGARTYKVPAIYEVAVDSDHWGDNNDRVEPYVLSSEEWREWPQPPRDGTYLSLRLRPYAAVLGRVVWENRRLLVTADWGFPSVPEDVAKATAFVVKHWLESNAAALPRPDQDPNMNDVPKRGIPMESMQILEHYKRAVAW